MSMPTRSLAMVAALACAVAPAAHTQAEIRVGGGATLPMGGAADLLLIGAHGVAGVVWLPADLPVGIQVEAMYHHIGGDTDVVGDADFRVINGTVAAVYRFRLSPASRFEPYALAGIGLYNTKFIGDAAAGSESSTDLGLNAGGGVDFAVSNLGLFLEARFHSILTGGESRNLLPISVGVRFGGPGREAMPQPQPELRSAGVAR